MCNDGGIGLLFLMVRSVECFGLELYLRSHLDDCLNVVALLGQCEGKTGFLVSPWRLSECGCTIRPM